MKNFPRLLVLLGALGVIGASSAVNAATVPPPIYNENTTLFGSGLNLTAAANIRIKTAVGAKYRFTVTNIGDPQSLLFPPFDVLGFMINESGNPTPLFESGTPGFTDLNLTPLRTYFVNVIGAVNPVSLLDQGTFNLKVQVIPIPAAAVLFSSAIFGLVVVARRRSKSVELVSA